MKTPAKLRYIVAAGVLAVVASTALISSNGLASAEDDAAVTSLRSSDWVGTWTTAITPGNATGGLTHDGLTDQTARMIVHTSVGGSQLRVRLSNLYGEKPLQLGHATVALPDSSTADLTDLKAGTVRELTFGGAASTTILVGAEAVSDPVKLTVGDLSDLVITAYFPVNTGLPTFHYGTRQSTFLATGDHAADPSIPDTAPGYRNLACCWFFVSGVDVERRKAAGSVVVLGDSISDGNGSTLNANTRWPDFLAKRLVHGSHGGRVPGVLNAGVAGNRLNHEGIEATPTFAGLNESGSNSSARLPYQVFSQPGAKTVIAELGINDIWMNGDSAEMIIAAIHQLATQVHERGLKFLVCTLGPYEGYATAGAWTAEKEATRQAVNSYLRSHRYDGLVDFDALLRDPAAPTKLRAEFDSGDHIHPNDAGYEAMADLVPLSRL